jgi:protein-S-isoprenylcysteine O-methyltransferase Ste14
MMARVAYAGVFCVVIPLIMVAWAIGLGPSVALPGWRSPTAGAVLTALGGGLMLAAWWSLWFRGGGFPMNAFPPPRRVMTGVYALLPHPIYTGAVLITAGVALWAGSAAGLWVVTPVLTLGCAALVLGYERGATITRLGEPLRRPWLSLPPEGDGRATWRERFGTLGVVLVPWLLAYEWIGHVPARAGWSGWIGTERSWPVYQWTEILYASVYLVVPLAGLARTTRSGLRDWGATAWIATGLGSLIYIVLPVTTPPREFEPDGVFGMMLALERADALDGRAALPSFHVHWILVSARCLAADRTRWRVPVLAWAAAATISCWTTGMHSILDIAAGVLFHLAVIHWRGWRRVALVVGERVANSWREWRFGPVRVINHGLYAGVGASVGVVLASTIAPDSMPALAFTALASLVGAAVVGQMLVGSSGTLRPFGYYGSVLGAALGLVIVGALGWADWRLAAGLAVAAPWIQGIGRLRCLVQGCCHGRPAALGIHYRHPRSRVWRLTPFGGKTLHATPLYSMLGNACLGLILLRLSASGASASLVVGLYAIGAGLVRFVEEHYRGEPLTPVLGGLRLYQWFAVVSVALGVVVSGVCSAPGVEMGPPPGLAWLWALGMGSVFFAGMGVDWPESGRRFSRLA